MELGGTHGGVRGTSLQRRHAHMASGGPSAVKERTVRGTKSGNILVQTSLFAPIFKTDLPSLQKSRQFLC